MKRSLNFAAMNMRVGVLVTVCTAMVFAVLFSPIRGISPFARTLSLYGDFDDVAGLKRNSPVYLAGMEAGTVDWVDFTPAGSPHRIRVKAHILDKVVHLVRRDSIMKITSQGLLGDKFVEITPGKPDEPPVRDGDTLVTEESSDMMAGMAALQGRVTQILDRTNAILAQAQSPETNLGKLFSDGKLYDELLAAVHEIRMASENLKGVSGSLNETLTDSKIHETVVSTVASVRKVADKVQEYTDKVDRLRFYLDLAGQKYGTSATPSFTGLADVRIFPNPDRYYSGGVEYANVTGNAFTDTLVYDAALGFRIPSTPVYFWGGMKRSSVGAGLDLALLNQTLNFTADSYHFDRTTAALDLGASYRFHPSFSLSGGVDDVFGSPLAHAGLSVTYNDRDITTILIQLKTGL